MQAVIGWGNCSSKRIGWGVRGWWGHTGSVHLTLYLCSAAPRGNCNAGRCSKHLHTTQREKTFIFCMFRYSSVFIIYYTLRCKRDYYFYIKYSYVDFSQGLVIVEDDARQRKEDMWLSENKQTNKHSEQKQRLTQVTEVTVRSPLWSTVPVPLLCLHLEKSQRVITHEKHSFDQM